MNFDERMTQDARLCMLKELGRQADGRLNEIALVAVLDTFAIKRTRDWVRTQLRRMEELDAVRIAEVGTVFVATLTRAGRDHIDRRALIEGIARPADEA